MRYKSDFDNSTQGVIFPQYRPCGTCTGEMPASMNPGVYQSQNIAPAALQNLPNEFQGKTGMLKPSAPMMMPNMMPAETQHMPMAPAGFPNGGVTAPLLPQASGMGGVPQTSTSPQVPTAPGWTNMPTTVESPLFTPGFLRTQIGRKVRVEFLLGTNSFTDRTGTLIAVGASYILIRLVDSDDVMLCDIYSIKFVTFIL